MHCPCQINEQTQLCVSPRLNHERLTFILLICLDHLQVIPIRQMDHRELGTVGNLSPQSISIMDPGKGLLCLSSITWLLKEGLVLLLIWI